MTQTISRKISQWCIWLIVIAIGSTSLAWNFVKFQPTTEYQAKEYRYPFNLNKSTNRLAELQLAIDFYRSRVQKNPQGGLDLAGLAHAYWRMGKATGEPSWYLLADQNAQRSLAILPFSNTGAQLTLARVAQAQHNFANGIKIAKDILQEKPRQTEAESILVTCYLATGKLTEAEKMIVPLTQRAPTLEILTLQALVKEARGDRLTQNYFAQAIAAEEPSETSSSAFVRVLLGRHYFRHGQLGQAESITQEALRISPNYPLALLQLATIATRRGQYQQAESFYDRTLAAVARTGAISDRIVLRGKARLQQLQRQNFKPLLDQVEMLLREETNGQGINFGHRRELAELLLDRHQPAATQEALQLMQAEIKVRQDAQTLATLAKAWARIGEFPKARTLLEKVLALGTQEPTFFIQLAQVEQQLGNPTQATFYTQAALKIDPTFNAQTQQAIGF